MRATAEHRKDAAERAPRRRVHAAAAIALAALAFASPPAHASCICRPVTVQTALLHSAAVFTGTVVSIDSLTGENGFYTHSITLIPGDCWKGTLSDTVTVGTNLNEEECGVAFALGEEYLVYADASYGLPTDFYTDLCMRTINLRWAAYDLAELGPPDCRVSLRRTSWGDIKRLYGAP